MDRQGSRLAADAGGVRRQENVPDGGKPWVEWGTELAS